MPLSTAFDVKVIFNDLGEIISIHDLFLSKLSQIVSRDMKYVDVLAAFLELIHQLTPLYKDFCSHQRESSRAFETKFASDVRFRQIVTECQKNLTRMIQHQQELVEKESNKGFIESSCAITRAIRNQNLPVASYIIKPMQRITKYYLLFERISKSIDKMKQPDLSDIAEKLSKSASFLCETVNETCRAKDDFEDNQRKLKWAQNHIKQVSSNEVELDYRSKVMHSIRQSREIIFFESKTNCMGDRKLVKAGNMFKWRTGRELAIFLFNDVLLLTVAKSVTLAGVDDIFTSGKAQQSYYKLYKPPILVENVAVLQEGLGDVSMDSQSSRSSLNEKNLLSVCFTNKSTGEIFNLLANSLAEKDRWIKALDLHSAKAREARHNQQQVLSSRNIVTKPTADEAYGRLLITILEVKSVKQNCDNRRSLLEIDDDVTKHPMFSWKISVHAQLKREKTIGLFDSDSATRTVLNISDIYKTNPVPFNIYCSSSHDELKARYADESTQFLLPKKLLDDGQDLLDLNVFDEPAYRESHLLGSRRIDLDRMIGLASSQSSNIGGTSSRISNKLLPERPTELAFRIKPVKAKNRISSRNSLDSNLSYQQCSPKQIKQDRELWIKLRFHLHLFQ